MKLASGRRDVISKSKFGMSKCTEIDEMPLFLLEVG